MRGRVEPAPREASKAPGRYRPVAGLAIAEPVSAIHQLVALACPLVTAWILASSVVLDSPSTAALTLLGAAGLALLRWDRTNRHRLSRRPRTPPAG